MKFKIIFIITSILYGGITAAQDAPNKTDAAGKKQGHWIKLDDDKKKIYDGNFENDIPVGKFTYYYNTGIVRSYSVFSQKGKVTRTQVFNSGGTLSAEGKYLNEKKDSLWKFYNSEAKLLSDEIYVNGLKNGACKIYYANGQPAEEKNWKDGILNGVCKKYFEDGQIKYTGQYINNKVEGKAVFYQATGKVEAEGVYKDDLKDGDWKYYKEDGTLKRTDKYIEGKLQGADRNVITKEELEKQKKQYEETEIKDPYQEGYKGD
jgi:antitoxin component YwqK of YwqJK toxin-antitoxin module